MATNLCKFSNVSKEKLKDLLAGKKRQTDAFKCGGCSHTFDTICVLHVHCMKHNHGGSYFFDHVTNTAFPKYDSICSYSQVEVDRLGRAPRYGEKVLAAVPRLINVKVNKLTKEPAVVGTDQGKGEEESVDILVDAQPDQTNEDVDPDPDETSNKDEMCVVKVKNIVKAADGSITFEMDEKDAYLFDATATVIMERFQKMGDDWINETDTVELKVRIPQTVSSKSTVKVGADQDYTNSRVETNTASSVQSGKTLSTVNVEKSAAENTETKEIINDQINTLVSNDLDMDSDSEISFSPVKMETSADKVKSEGVVGRRCGRKRKPTARILDTDWKRPVRKSQSGRSCNKETADFKSDEAEDIERETSENNSKDDYQGIQGETSPADLNASEVLLSLGIEPASDQNLSETETEVKNTRRKSKRIRKPTKRLDMVIIKEEQTIEQVPETSENAGESVEKNEVKSEDMNDEEYGDGLPLCKRRDHKCPVCQKLGTKAMVEYHKQMHSSDTLFMCEVCPKQFKTKACLRLHQSKHGEKIFNCDVCPASFYQKGVLRAHQRKHNGGVPDYKKRDLTCPVCGKVGTKAMVDYHQQIHSDEKPFTCDVCGKGFKTKASLRAHVRQHGEKTHKCDKCPAAFYRKQYLRTHQLKHTGEMPYVCDTCGKAYKEYYILQRHISNIHKQVRNFQCDICNDCFFRADTRDIHRARHFEGTLKCKFCCKMFKAELDRRKHELTHTGEKQFFCPMCSQGFAQLWPYYKHMWKKHNIRKEEAKEVKIKNPDLVFMRNKYGTDVDIGKNEQDAKLREPVEYHVYVQTDPGENNENSNTNTEQSSYQQDSNSGIGIDNAVVPHGSDLVEHVYGEQHRDMYETEHHMYVGDGVSVDEADVIDGVVGQAGNAGGRVQQGNVVILTEYADIEEYAKGYSRNLNIGEVETSLIGNL